jgi:hypothetical protein
LTVTPARKTGFRFQQLLRSLSGLTVSVPETAISVSELAISVPELPVSLSAQRVKSVFAADYLRRQP